MNPAVPVDTFMRCEKYLPKALADFHEEIDRNDDAQSEPQGEPQGVVDGASVVSVTVTIGSEKSAPTSTPRFTVETFVST